MSRILGLTGSIGMGKSTTATLFREAGIPVWDADASVHALYSRGGAGVALIGALHPAAVSDGSIDRAALRAWIAIEPRALSMIEAAIHPLVAQSRAAFLAQHAKAPLVVLDVPLLFETGGERTCDATLAVSVPAEVQRARVLARPGMTEAYLATILAKQMPDAEKRARATHVIETTNLDKTRADVHALIAELTTGAPMREIVLDTETTGFEPSEGHRVVEIGCVELFNHMPSGRTWHQYLNPQRDMPPDAFAVHGLSEDFLRPMPLFTQVADQFLRFVDGARLIIHNAVFDLKFLNAELTRAGKAALRNDVVDTVAFARRRFPGSPASLDALCRRFGINNSNRTLHGALLDSEILAEVYLELIGGRQPDFGLGPVAAAVRTSASVETGWRPQPRPQALPSRLSPDEAAAHAALIQSLGEKALWRRYEA